MEKKCYALIILSIMVFSMVPSFALAQPSSPTFIEDINRPNLVANIQPQATQAQERGFLSSFFGCIFSYRCLKSVISDSPPSSKVVPSEEKTITYTETTETQTPSQETNEFGQTQPTASQAAKTVTRKCFNTGVNTSGTWGYFKVPLPILLPSIAAGIITALVPVFPFASFVFFSIPKGYKIWNNKYGCIAAAASKPAGQAAPKKVTAADM